MSTTADGIAPDTKDWTWVLDRPCPECGFDPTAQSLTDLPGAFHDTAMAWSDVLLRSDVLDRPSPEVWSPLEYACHVRVYATVTDATRGRRGVRSNGDEFTVETLGSHHAHDVVHHLHDVGAS